MSTVLLTSVTQRDVTNDADRRTFGGGASVIEIAAQGDPVLATTIRALEERYPRRDPEELVGLAADGERVTLMCIGQNFLGAPIISAEEGKLFPTSHPGCVAAYLPKGKRTKGLGLKPERVLDFVTGYGGVEALRGRLEEERARLPRLRPLTVERLRQLPEQAPEEGARCTLAAFGRWALPYEETTTAVWLLHSYMAEDDIAEGVLFVPPEIGTSEHGSVYGRDLLGLACEVEGFDGYGLREAMRLTEDDDGGHAAALLLVGQP